MKKILITFLTAVAFALALSGCNREFVINTAQVSAGVALLDVQFDGVTQTVSRLDFSPVERAKLEMAHQQLDELRSVAHELVLSSGGLPEAIVKIDQVRRLADAGRSAYSTAREVICPNAADDLLTPGTCPRLAQLSGPEQERLVAFDLHARHTNDSLQQLLDSPEGTNITQTISDVLTVGAAAARIVQIGGLL